MKFIEQSQNCKAIVIMVQEEVALRICAKAGTADYGAITASINLVADSEIIQKVPRTMFMPAPNVDSAVVKIVFNRNKYPNADKKVYRDTVRCAFLSRRKTLTNNLREWLKISKEEAERLLLDCNVNVMARGETLTEEDFVTLSALIKERFLKN